MKGIPTPPKGVDPDKWRAGWVAAASSCPNPECRELHRKLNDLL